MWKYSFLFGMSLSKQNEEEQGFKIRCLGLGVCGFRALGLLSMF